MRNPDLTESRVELLVSLLRPGSLYMDELLNRAVLSSEVGRSTLEKVLQYALRCGKIDTVSGGKYEIGRYANE